MRVLLFRSASVCLIFPLVSSLALFICIFSFLKLNQKRRTNPLREGYDILLFCFVFRSVSSTRYSVMFRFFYKVYLVPDVSSRMALYFVLWLLHTSAVYLWRSLTLFKAAFGNTAVDITFPPFHPYIEQRSFGKITHGSERWAHTDIATNGRAIV